jgi:hypothetical protein
MTHSTLSHYINVVKKVEIKDEFRDEGLDGKSDGAPDGRGRPRLRKVAWQ